METQPSKYIPARDNRQPRFVALNQKSALLMAGSTLRSTHVSQAASLAKGVAVCSSRRSPVRRRGDHTATLHRAEWLSLLDLPTDIEEPAVVERSRKHCRQDRPSSQNFGKCICSCRWRSVR